MDNETGTVPDASVEAFDDAFARNDTLVSLYANWPYCSGALQTNGSLSNASGVESEKMPLPLFEFATSLFLLVVVAMPGMAGNFISIFILSRPQMRSSLNVILIGATRRFRPVIERVHQLR